MSTRRSWTSASTPIFSAMSMANLFRYELGMTLQPVSDETIEEIVDTVFLPLLESRKGR